MSGPMADEFFEEETPTLREVDRAVDLVARGLAATLCSSGLAPPGFPFAAVVSYVLMDGTPILLLSSFDDHSNNLVVDDRCSLVCMEEVPDVPLHLRSRVTLIGRCTVITDEAALERATEVFRGAHDASRFELGLTESRLWQIEVSQIRYVGGFGHMSVIGPAEWYETAKI